MISSEERLDNKNTATLIFGNKSAFFENFNEIFPDISPKLILIDLSIYYSNVDIEIKEINRKKSFLSHYDLFKSFSLLNESYSESFWSNIINMFQKCASIIQKDGFLAILTNGQIKSELKSILDTIFGFEHFVNELVIDSPFMIKYVKDSSVFESTNYLLIYTKSDNPIINPLFNKKVSGGYWHSFVSKGQGKPKIFIINQEEILLEPPIGTHWKLNQEKIIELCKKGTIRLNKKGNPEYWVQSKKGQIIDTNWLDICSYEMIFNKYFVNSYDFYNRLLKLFLNRGEVFIDTSPNVGISALTSKELEIVWIGIEENQTSFAKTMEYLTEKKVQYSVINLTPKASDQVQKCLSIPNNLFMKKFNPLRINKTNIQILERYFSYFGEYETIDNKKWKNMLIWGDCLDVLPNLAIPFKKKIKLIYIDPPFFTGTNEKIVIPIGKLKNKNYSSEKNFTGFLEDVAYNNILKNESIDYFVNWFGNRVFLMKSLLREDGFIFVRFDYHFGHYAKLILDQIFGKQNFICEFLVRRMKKNLSLKQLNNQTHLIVHYDSVFTYRASEKSNLNMSQVHKKRRKNQDINEYKHFNDNIWIDIAGYQKAKKTLYPTENSETLLIRIIKIASDENDLIADFLCGSGTTLAVAEKFKRRWIGIDISRYSVHEIKKRLLNIPNKTPFDFLIAKKEEYFVNLKSSKENTIKLQNQISFDLDLKISNKTLEIKLIPSELIPSRTDNFMYYIDFWAVDWNFKNKIDDPLHIGWYSFRKLKGKTVLIPIRPYTNYTYANKGTFTVAILIVDVFNNVYKKTFEINIH